MRNMDSITSRSSDVGVGPLKPWSISSLEKNGSLGDREVISFFLVGRLKDGVILLLGARGPLSSVEKLQRIRHWVDRALRRK